MLASGAFTVKIIGMKVTFDRCDDADGTESEPDLRPGSAYAEAASA